MISTKTLAFTLLLLSAPVTMTAQQVVPGNRAGGTVPGREVVADGETGESGGSSAQSACADPARSLLWQVEGRNSTVYLFGSIHVGKPDFYPLHEQIESAYHGADHIVFEVDPRAAASPEVAIQIQTRGLLPGGTSLRDVLSEETLNQLVMTLTGLGLPADNFMNYQPWFLTLLLNNMQMASLGYAPSQGIEAYLIRHKPDLTDVLELESIQEQISFLQELNGESYLAYTLLGFEDAKETINEMINAWKCGDQEDLDRIIFTETEEAAGEDPEMEVLFERMFYDRNMTMASGVRGFLDTGSGKYFVVVGAGHLIGERSVIDLLDDDYPVKNIRLE